ncbi:MAG: hypothetical protein R3F19_16675 [Verrucomicrobiales bacterium]
MRAIVGFEIEITRIEGKFMLSQNRLADAPASWPPSKTMSIKPTGKWPG